MYISDPLCETLKNDAETSRCKGDRKRGHVSISDLFVCIDLS